MSNQAINRNSVLSFFSSLGEHCRAVLPDNCEKCGMRIFCYTPPCEISGAMVQQVIDLLEGETRRDTDCPIR